MAQDAAWGPHQSTSGLRNTLSVLGGFNKKYMNLSREFMPSMDGRRLALAKWLARKDNPLVLRSIVNRVWQWIFGKGIVGTANNFGKMGKKPTHPELLDYLAQEFIKKDRSIKSLIRLIAAKLITSRY